jgi:hypothetical protein
MQKLKLLTQPHHDMSFSKSIQQDKLDKKSCEKIVPWRQLDLDQVVKKRSKLNEIWIKRAPQRAEILHDLNMRSNQLVTENILIKHENNILTAKSREISDRTVQIDVNKHMIVQLKSEIDTDDTTTHKLKKYVDLERKCELEEIKIENKMMFIAHAEEAEYALMANMDKCIKRKKKKKHRAKPVNSKIHAHHIKHNKIKQRRKQQRATKFAMQHTPVVFSKHVNIPNPTIHAITKRYDDLCQ